MTQPTTDNSTPRKTNRMASVIWWLVLAGILGAAFWFGAKTLREAPDAAGAGGPPPGPGGPPPAAVRVATTIATSERIRVSVSGSLRAATRSDIAVLESGAIKQLFVDVGDRVQTGDPLAAIDDRRLLSQRTEIQANQTAAQALITQREAERKRADEDLEMKKALAAERAISKRELMDAEREAAVSAARDQAARDQLAALSSQLDLNDIRQQDLKVFAPFDGRVVSRHAEPGEWLAAGSPLVTLVSSGTIEAWLDVPERYAALVTTNAFGMSIHAEGVADPIPVLELRQIPEVDARSRFFPAVALVDDLGGALIPGMSVSAQLPTGTTQSMVAVPTDAVIYRQGGPMVFRPAPPPEGGGLPSAEPVPVEELFRRDGLAYLRADRLSAGDAVIVEGNERLFPGTPLLIAPPANAAGPAPAGAR